MKRLAIVLALALLCTSVPAQQSRLPTGPAGIPDPNKSQFPGEGAANSGGAGGAGGVGASGTGDFKVSGTAGGGFSAAVTTTDGTSGYGAAGPWGGGVAGVNAAAGIVNGTAGTGCGAGGPNPSTTVGNIVAHTSAPSSSSPFGLILDANTNGSSATGNIVCDWNTPLLTDFGRGSRRAEQWCKS